jgi:phosphoesterase RecJ-like protein
MTSANPDRAALHEFLERHQRFLLTTHVNPDGDAIGSEVAFARWLLSRGKQVRILNDSPTPAAFQWLVAGLDVEVYDEALCETRFAEADALVVLDTSNKQRIGRLAKHLDLHAIAVAVVDHHVTHDGFGQVNVVEPALASTASLVWDLVGEAGWTPDAIAAEALYVGLFTDTGNFRYSNSDAHAHRMAASLIELGVQPEVTTARVTSSAPAGRLRFFGEVLSTLVMLEGGRLAVLEATPDQFARNGLVGADTEGLVDMPRIIAGVEVVALFSEVEPGKIKVSLRSTGRVSIDQVCARWGGGGHPHAAGVQMRGSREDAKGRILPELARVLAALDAAPAAGTGA